jgi:hypothetical protein
VCNEKIHGGACEKAILDETPNAETLEAMEELENGGGYKFSGTTGQLFTELLKD